MTDDERDRVIEAYRQFAANVAEHLTYVFSVEGYQRGSAKQTRAVLSAIREDLRTVRRTAEFPGPDNSEVPPAGERVDTSRRSE